MDHSNNSVVLTLASLVCLGLLVLVSLPIGAVSYDLIDRDLPGQDNQPINAVKYTLTFDFKPELTTRIFRDSEYDDLGLEECLYAAEYGCPQVPFFAQPLYVKGEIIDVKVTTGPGSVFLLNLPPAPEPNNPWLEPILYKDEGVWNSDAYYPDYQYYLTQVGFSIGKEETTTDYSFSIYPLQYNPVTGIGIFHRSMTFDIYVDEGEDNTRSEEGTRDITEEPTRGLTSYTWDGVEEIPPRILIISLEKYLDDLQPLINWKERKGYPVKTADVNWIKDNVIGNDTSDKMRNYIKQINEDYDASLQFVLLAGDYDEVPTRVCKDNAPHAGWDDGKVPSDTYYACLGQASAKFWDGDQDNNFAEMGEIDDKIPDLFVTRIAIKDQAKMALWAQEMIEYETDQPDSGNFGATTVLAAGTGHAPNDSQDHSDYLWNKYLNKIFTTKETLYEGSDTLTSATINQKVTAGTGYLNFIDHGGPAEWCKNYGNSLCYKGDSFYSDYSHNNVIGTANENEKPVIVAMACLTNWFDDPSGCLYGSFFECMGEAWTEGNIEDGALGYGGFSRSATAAISCQNYPAAEGLQEEFIRQMNLGNLNLGKAFMQAKEHYAQIWGAYWNQPETLGNWMEFNFLGDPEIPMFAGTPGTIQVTAVQSHEVLEKYQVTVKDGVGVSLSNAIVCVENMDQGIYAFKKTDANGIANFELTVYGNTTVNLTVTKPDYLPYVSTDLIKDMTPPETEFTIDPVDPDGEISWYNTIPTITLTCNEVGGKNYYRWNDGPNTLLSEDSLPAISGHNQFHYYSIDLAGNKGAEGTKEVNVDTVSPVTTIITDPESPNGNDDWYIDSRPLVSISLADDNASSTTSYLSWDGVTDWLYDGPFEAKEGEHTLYYYTKDSSGHKEGERSKVIKVDSEAPETFLKIDPKVPDGNNGYYISGVNVTLLKDSDKTIAWYRWDTDGDLKVYQNKLSASDGVHTLYYFSEDFHGNQEEVKTYTVKVDNTPPETALTVTPAKADGLNDWYVTEPTINMTLVDNLDLGNATIFYYWDNEIDMPIEYLGDLEVPEGEHTIHYWSVDLAGNTELTKDFEIKVDTKTPISNLFCPVNPDKDGWYRNIPLIEISTDDDAIIMYKMDDSDVLEWPEGQQLKIDTGYHTLRFYSVDDAGNTEAEKKIDFNVDTESPTVEIDAPSKVTKGDKVTITLTATDDLGIKEYFFDFGDGKDTGWIKENEATHKYNKTNDYTVTIKVRDVSGQEYEEDIDIEVEKEEDDGIIPGISPDSSAGVWVLIVIILLLFVGGGAVAFLVIHKGKQKKAKKKEDKEEMTPAKPEPLQPKPKQAQPQQRPRPQAQPHPGGPPAPPGPQGPGPN